MIYTVTINPSIDYHINLDTLNSGTTNRSKGEYFCFGGKGINISAVLSRLSIETTALGFIAGFTGYELTQLLKKENINSDFISLPNGTTRINVKLNSIPETEINADGPQIDPVSIDKLYQKLDKLNDNDYICISGNLPSSLPNTTYSDMIKHLRDNKCRAKIIVDCTGNSLLNTLQYRPFLIKPNLNELSELFQAKLHNEEAIVNSAKLLQSKGALNVLVSLGADGSLLIADNSLVYKIKAPTGALISSVGAGDSMIAGFLAGYQQTKDYDYSLKLATACGSATAFSKGLATTADISELLLQISCSYSYPFS